MKTSNKLLITFAAALILVPILGMVYISQVKYKIGKPSDVVEHKIENFSTPTANMTSIPTSAFTTVNVADAGNNRIGIRYMKDEKSGIKIPDEYKALITATVDANGQLQVEMKSVGHDHDYISILVYAPTLKVVNVNNSEATYLTASIDSITYNVTKSGNVGIGQDAHIGLLNLHASDVEEIRFQNDDIKSLSLALNNASIKTVGLSFDKVAISTTGKCDVEIVGDYESAKNFEVKELALNTVGNADVKLININVLNCTGSLSDQTNIQMPVANLKQLFTK